MSGIVLDSPAMLHKWNIIIFLTVIGLILLADRVRISIRMDQDHVMLTDQDAHLKADDAALKQLQVIQIEQEKLIEDIRSSQQLDNRR